MKKESVLNLFESSALDSRLDIFYQAFGPSVRSEYSLDALKIVDLDWETFGCVITFVEGILEQIHFTLLAKDDKTYEGWMGDGVKKGLTMSEVKASFGISDTFSYTQNNYSITFEFSSLNIIKSITLRSSNI